MYDSGLVRYEQKYPCHTDSGTIENVRSLELSEVLLEESTQPRVSYLIRQGICTYMGILFVTSLIQYCLRFRSANEEPFEEVFDSLQYNGYYRVEGSIHKHNVPERQRVVDRVNEFLESKGKLVHKAAHQSSKKAFDDTTLMSNPLVAKRASSRAQKSAPEQQAESSSIQGKTTDESRDFPSSNHVDNPLRQNQDTTESPQGATTESSNSKTGTPAPRRKTMKEIMDARLAS